MNCVAPCPIRHYRKSLTKFGIKKTSYNIYVNGGALDVLVYTYKKSHKQNTNFKKSVCSLIYENNYLPAWLQ